MRWGLRTTIILSLTGIFTAVSLLISVVVLRVNERLLLEEAARGAQATAQVIASGLEAQVPCQTREHSFQDLRFEPALLQDGVERLSRLPDVKELAVVSPGLRLLAHSEPALAGQRLLDPEIAPTLLENRTRGEVRQVAEASRVYLAYVPLRSQGDPVHVLRVTFALESLDHQLSGAFSLVMIFLGLDALLVILVGSWLLDRLIVRPLRRIAVATERVTSGTFDPIWLIESGNEIGRLSVSFNQMVDALSEQQRKLQEKIAELSQANQELAQARDSMIRAERLASVGTLAAGVAHEVGNPLAAILGYTELLLQESGQAEQEAGLSPADAHELIVRINQQTLRIHRIIRELLDYSRTRTGPAQDSCELAHAVSLTLSLLRPQPKLRGISLEADLPDGLPPVGIEEERLVQVLLNLLLNAADALQDRKGVGSILIRAAAPLDRNSGYLPLTVEDNGPGIPPEILERVFDPFFTTKAPGEGTGLGLAICERILSDAGGEISLHSEPGHGTSVILRLPLATQITGPAPLSVPELPD